MGVKFLAQGNNITVAESPNQASNLGPYNYQAGLSAASWQPVTASLQYFDIR